MYSNDLIVKDNALINASYNLDTIEQRLMLLAIVQARKTQSEIDANTRLRIHASEYMERFNVNKHAAYKALKTAVTNLFGRQFTYYTIDSKTGKQKKVISRWVQNIAYIDEAAILEVTFTVDVIPLITRLEKQFTSYQLKQVSQLSGKYAIRLYELLISWREVGKTPIFEISDFRSKLGLGSDDYPRIDTFKRRVLESAIKQINEHTDIIVKVEQHKEGRSISGFSFSYKTKKSSNAKKLTIIKTMTDKQRHYFASKLSELPELGHYSEGTESYQQFAIRIAEMLKDSKKIEEFLPYLNQVGFESV
ncbi:replication initiation protein RepM [Acinetobacter sp. B51(2017)]|uniref:replication initiation protein RepM n=1 Tax=Acinetobacter sp. B51(2017) TaxID=2060938 RepID=UPI000F094436|nr:replication initiation protein RepM [Acinetobacter sp. B51(2017)]